MKINDKIWLANYSLNVRRINDQRWRKGLEVYDESWDHHSKDDHDHVQCERETFVPKDQLEDEIGHDVKLEVRRKVPSVFQALKNTVSEKMFGFQT